MKPYEFKAIIEKAQNDRIAFMFDVMVDNVAAGMAVDEAAKHFANGLAVIYVCSAKLNELIDTPSTGNVSS